MPYIPNPTPKPVIKSKYSPAATGTGARIREPALQPQTNQTPPRPRTTTRKIVNSYDKTAVPVARIQRAAIEAKSAGTRVANRNLRSATRAVSKSQGPGFLGAATSAAASGAAKSARDSLRAIGKSYMTPIATAATKKLTSPSYPRVKRS